MISNSAGGSSKMLLDKSSTVAASLGFVALSGDDFSILSGEIY